MISLLLLILQQSQVPAHSANDFWGSVPGVGRASLSFGVPFGLESLLSSEPTKPVPVGTQAELIISVRGLAEQVRQG